MGAAITRLVEKDNIFRCVFVSASKANNLTSSNTLKLYRTLYNTEKVSPYLYGSSYLTSNESAYEPVSELWDIYKNRGR